MKSYTLTNADAVEILRKLRFVDRTQEAIAETLREILDDCDKDAPIDEDIGNDLMRLVMVACDA